MTAPAMSRLVPDEAASDRSAPFIKGAQSDGKTNTPWRVALVDDDAMVRNMLRSLLEEHANIQVVGEAPDGEKAIEMAECYRPDVILMDIQLPHVNGAEATRRINRKLPQIRIIAVSIQYTPHAYNAMMAAGAVAFVRKEDAAEALYKSIQFAMHLPPQHPSAFSTVHMERRANDVSLSVPVNAYGL